MVGGRVRIRVRARSRAIDGLRVRIGFCVKVGVRIKVKCWR